MANDRKEIEKPDWLNEEFFVNILKNKEGEKNVKITKCEITAGSGKNDHYASVMYRARIHFDSSNGSKQFRSWVVKVAPFMEGIRKELMKDYKLFQTEVKMYNEALPKIEAELRKHGDETKLSARSVYASLEPNQCLAFEDLVERGYTTFDRRYPDMEETKAALSKLAKLHAVSYKFGQENDSLITGLQEGTFSNPQGKAEDGTPLSNFEFIDNGIEEFLELSANDPVLKEYYPSIKKISRNLFSRVVESYRAHRDGERKGIFVLNHGDFHMKNMMVKRSGDKFEDLILVDYQISFFGSAAIDVIYALIMLFSPDMRLNHRDELIYYYFTTFQETLRKLNFKSPIPTLADFHYELLKHGHYELFLTMTFLMFNYVFIDDTYDLTKGIENKEYRTTLWKLPKVLEELRITLPRLLHRGCFEI